MTSPLAWGRRYLMCPPRYFDVCYEINPWMHREVRVDPERALTQWQNLREVLEDAGAAIDVLDSVRGVPDLVFTANAGVVNGRRFIPSRFRYPERQAETADDVAWFGHRASRSSSCRTTSTKRVPAMLCRSAARCSPATDGVLTQSPIPISRPWQTSHFDRSSRRRALVPPRPHVLPAGRSPGHRRPDGLGSLWGAGH